MRSYKRLRIAGAMYFFTVNLAERHGNDLLTRHIAELRQAFRRTRQDHPFVVVAAVVLPDHLHCLWQMPENDDDYSTRWRLIKARFSCSIEAGERISPSRQRKGERGLWQRRYWEHAIRDELDCRHHMDYIHYNPVKHGYARSPQEWPYSSFHQWAKRGAYPADWAKPVEMIKYPWD